MALWSPLLARPSQTPISSRPSLTLFFLLVGAFVLTLVPHAARFPVWLSVILGGAMLLRCLIEVHRLPLPSTIFCSIMAVVLAGVIFVEYGNIMGQDPGTAFTAGLLAIKFYELRSPRDVALIIFSCFFVVMSALLYDQFLELFIYCLIMMWVLTALLLRVHAGDLQQDYLIRMLGHSGIIFLQALPLALVLFFFFPRYTGNLSFSLDEAKIGVTDTVTPGSIAKLSRDGSIAMYVRFIPPNIPSTNRMYWRALVLWQYSGGAWTQGFLGGGPATPKDVPAAPESSAVLQEITLKANNQKWLVALDVPTTAPINSAESSSWATLLNGNIAQLSIGKLNHMVRYDVTSSLAPIEETMSRAQREAALQWPNDPKGEHINHSVIELANHLHQGLTDDQEQEYIARVMHFFRGGNFVYSTAPGVQGPDWLPVFLLKTRTGFCEHFASAFAVLMRIENVPARLVVGYQGADQNPYSPDVFAISQSNAHAWDEVWIPSDHLPPVTSQAGYWMRIDPTSPTAAAGAMPTASNNDTQDNLAGQINHQDTGLFGEYVPAWANDGLREMEWRREQVDANWDSLVLSFDPETQIQWAQHLGFGKKSSLGLGVTCLVAATICALIFRRWMMRKAPVSPVENLYAAFCRNMARRGIPRAAWEGPLAYTERVAEAFPDDKVVLQRVGDIVARARYGPVPADTAAHDHLKALLTATASREKR